MQRRTPQRERGWERERILALDAALSRADVALCQYYRGILALTKMTPFHELVGSVCANTHFKMLTRSLESKKLALHARMQWWKKNILIRTKKDKRKWLGAKWIEKKETENWFLSLKHPLLWVEATVPACLHVVFSGQKGKLLGWGKILLEKKGDYLIFLGGMWIQTRWKVCSVGLKEGAKSREGPLMRTLCNSPQAGTR